MAKQVTISLGNRALRTKFQTILPRIECHARIYFRNVRCSHKKEDLIAETVAVAWQWFVRLADKGKDATQWPSAFATLAARAVKSGRRVAGMNKAKDALNEYTQARKGFVVESLPISTRTSHEDLYGSTSGQRRQDSWEERLQDNTMTPPPEQAAFRIDFPAWLALHCDRDRAILRDMAMGEWTKALAERYRLSQGRVSQMRREAMESWEKYTA